MLSSRGFVDGEVVGEERPGLVGELDEPLEPRLEQLDDRRNHSRAVAGVSSSRHKPAARRPGSSAAARSASGAAA